jgi:hypothetical protein
LDPHLVEAWIGSRFKVDSDHLTEVVNRTLLEIGFEPYEDDPVLSREENARKAAEHIDALVAEVAQKGVNGFKRHAETGELFIEGRHIKSSLKESVNIRYPWITNIGEDGKGRKNYYPGTRKGWRGYFAEHAFVDEAVIPIGIKEPVGVTTRFPTNKNNERVILREEYVTDVYPEFHVSTDLDWDMDQWGLIWVTAQRQGLGASRSQGYGVFTVEEWEQVQ